MLHRFTLALLAASCLYANACTVSSQTPEKAPLAHYHYPAATVLGAQYSPGQHYALTIYDEGEGGIQKITVQPSDKNQIGDKESVTDESLIFIEGHTYSYLAFYDDWTIQESVEVVFDEDGAETKTVTVLYNKTGVPTSIRETPAL